MMIVTTPQAPDAVEAFYRHAMAGPGWRDAQQLRVWPWESAADWTMQSYRRRHGNTMQIADIGIMPAAMSDTFVLIALVTLEPSADAFTPPAGGSTLPAQSIVPPPPDAAPYRPGADLEAPYEKHHRLKPYATAGLIPSLDQ